MLETLKKIFAYLIDKTPGSTFNYYTLSFIFIGILVLISFGLRNVYNRKLEKKDFVYKKMFKQLANRLVYFAIGFLFFILVRYENIPYFSMRLWLILLGIGLAAFVGRQLYKYFKIYPKELENFHLRPRASETPVYLPNKKRR